MLQHMNIQDMVDVSKVLSSTTRLQPFRMHSVSYVAHLSLIPVWQSHAAMY